MKKDFNPRFAYFLHEKEREEQDDGNWEFWVGACRMQN